MLLGTAPQQETYCIFTKLDRRVRIQGKAEGLDTAATKGIVQHFPNTPALQISVCIELSAEEALYCSGYWEAFWGHTFWAYLFIETDIPPLIIWDLGSRSKQQIQFNIETGNNYPKTC